VASSPAIRLLHADLRNFFLLEAFRSVFSPVQTRQDPIADVTYSFRRRTCIARFSRLMSRVFGFSQGNKCRLLRGGDTRRRFITLPRDHFTLGVLPFPRYRVFLRITEFLWSPSIPTFFSSFFSNPFPFFFPALFSGWRSGTRYSTRCPSLYTLAQFSFLSHPACEKSVLAQAPTLLEYHPIAGLAEARPSYLL